MFSFVLSKSPSDAPPNTRTCTLYDARLPCVIAREWIFAPVQMGFGSGPCVIGLWYQPATRLSSKVSQRPKVVHSFHRRLKLSSNMEKFWRCFAMPSGLHVLLSAYTSPYSPSPSQSSLKCRHVYMSWNAFLGMHSMHVPMASSYLRVDQVRWIEGFHLKLCASWLSKSVRRRQQK